VLSNAERLLFNTNPSVFKPWFKNSDVYRYTTNTVSNEFVVYATRDIEIAKTDLLYQHFLKFEKVIKGRNQDRGELQAALKHGKWWVIFAARRDISFDDPKIVVPQRSFRNTFGYNENPWYASADVYFITKKQSNISLKYLLALLNSKLFYVWLYYKGKRKGEMLELYQNPLSEIPIKIISKNDQIPFVDIVNKILAAKRANPAADTSVIEAEIDRLVYGLYGLTEEEIAIVEGQVGNPAGLECDKDDNYEDVILETDPANSVAPVANPMPLEIPVESTQSDYGLYKCSICGQLVTGFMKDGHAQEKHSDKAVKWQKLGG
jgi:adenine-specific DNA-methyltransferase